MDPPELPESHHFTQGLCHRKGGDSSTLLGSGSGLGWGTSFRPRLTFFHQYPFAMFLRKKTSFQA
eukprot:12604643-Prorocentrum_lima.AAC.1